MPVPEITCHELKTKLDKKEDIIIIDVREEHELDVSRIEGSIHIPLGDIDDHLDDLDKDKSYIMQCRSGGRSAVAAEAMIDAGFKDVKNLVGGINVWVTEIDPSQPTY